MQNADATISTTLHPSDSTLQKVTIEINLEYSLIDASDRMNFEGLSKDIQQLINKYNVSKGWQKRVRANSKDKKFDVLHNDDGKITHSTAFSTKFN